MASHERLLKVGFYLKAVFNQKTVHFLRNLCFAELCKFLGNFWGYLGGYLGVFLNGLVKFKKIRDVINVI